MKEGTSTLKFDIRAPGSAGDDGDDLIGVKGLDDENSLEGGPNAFPQQEEKAATDWEVPTISEEALDKLTTMFTIYPT